MNPFEPAFIVFFGVVVAIHRFAGASRAPAALQNLVLLVSSVLVLGAADPWVPLVPLVMGLGQFYAARALASVDTGRQLILLAAVALNVAIFGAFKAQPGCFEIIDLVWVWRGQEPSRYMASLIPLGLAFYTLRSLSWTMEVYRHRALPPARLLDFLAWVAFFPLAWAGPLTRPAELSLDQPRWARGEQLLSGLALTMWGAVQVRVVAANLAPWIDGVFALDSPSWTLLYAGSIGFAVQVFASFSGWVDAARGVARMLGFEVPATFDRPFLAAHPADFWRRWNVSLSSWFDDYVRTPLAGRVGPTTATLVSFALIGLWHQASLLFLAFGLWHGAWVVAHAWLSRWLPPLEVARPLAVAATFLGVVVPGWTLFRVASAERLVQLAADSPLLPSPHELMAAAVLLGVISGLVVPLWLGSVARRTLGPRLKRHPVWPALLISAIAACGVAVWLFQPPPVLDYLYITF